MKRLNVILDEEEIKDLQSLAIIDCTASQALRKIVQLLYSTKKQNEKSKTELVKSTVFRHDLENDR